ncbi:carboxymuconolactone decarboxylase family protein [Streptomyces canus]|uniref:carboxymuconolactone decarboxylase family protein n=1 Tax=Streptomyces canus TaxID=58343 RepID=UPI0032443F25
MEYPDPSALPTELQEAVTKRGSVNVYRMIMHSPGLAPGFLEMADAIFQGNSLPDQLRELAIVRVGHVYRAPYEIHHHENIGRLIGLSEAAIGAAATGATQALSKEETSILRLTDRLLAHHTLSDAERTEALEFLTVGQLSDLVVTVGFYQLVSNFLNTFGVTTEGETTPY